MDIKWLEEFHPQERLSKLIAAELADDEDDTRFEELSKALGYASTTIPNRWMTLKSKVPLRRLSGIAKFFKHDILDLLPLWIMQEEPDDGSLYLALSRLPSSLERDLIRAARNIYINPLAFLDDDLDDEEDDDEEYDGSEDDEE